MSFPAIVAGAPFFFAVGEGEGDGLGFGVSPASGVGLGLADGIGDSPGVGVGVGEGDEECLRFFLGDALGEASDSGAGEDFFFFFGEVEALGSGESSGVGLAEAFFFFEGEGDGDFSGLAEGFGVGDFPASSFFLEAVEVLRCFRGAGVGVGAKIFLILVPNDCSAGACCESPTSSAATKMVAVILRIRRMGP
ncbi:MAG: hypothetical protein QOH88_2337 [Verrucomicrobiota bacterium]|jgi:hypothetical protein